MFSSRTRLKKTLPELPVIGFLLLLALCPAPAAAQMPEPTLNPALLKGAWPAHWIAHPTASRTDVGVFHFRRTFDLGAAPERFVVHVSADNRYRLFVNGTPVGSGPARGDLANWRFETYDLAPYLQAGENVAAAVVWNFAEHRPEAQISLRTAFLLQGDTARERVIDTGPGWKVTRNAGHTAVPVDREALGRVYIVVGHNGLHRVDQ